PPDIQAHGRNPDLESSLVGSEMCIRDRDTAAKITILANTVLGADVKIQDIPRQGISHVTADHIRDWKKENVIPRLVGFIHIKNQQIQTGVELRLVPANHPFAHLQGSNKCIRVLTQEMGEFVVSGGASAPLATAAAALKDFELMLKTGYYCLLYTSDAADD
ncbi:hypothetical protein ACN6QQ_18225, partial [Acinetobacter baumannii]